MQIAAAVASLLLAALVTAAAVRKLTHHPRVVDSYRRAGVQESQLNRLAAVLLAGAAGLLVGIWWLPAGIAAAIGLVGYFIGAVISHVRANDTGRILTPIGYGALAAVVLALRVVAG
jgi:hypothetical protein